MTLAKIVRLHGFGGPEVLQIDEVCVGEPGAGEVRIRVGAFGLNRVETMYRSGGFGPVSFPAKIGYEAAGIVEALGPNVAGWAVGDRVAMLFGLSMEKYGTCGELILYPADRLVRLPDGQSLVEAAASWMQYGTAYGLVEVGHVAPGDFVVINAASSSVGLAAIQIANDHGAVSIAVTRGRDKADRLRALGAAHVIISDEEDVAARVLALTGGVGARILFDAVAGAQLGAMTGAMAPGGIIIVYGMLGGYETNLALPTLMLNNLTLRGFSAHILVEQADTRARLVDYVGRGTLKPVIDRVFPLAEIVDAHRYLESNAQLGKIVVTTDTHGE